MLTQELVRELFHYDDGFLFRRKDASNQARVGDLAGYKHHTGYWYVGVSGKKHGIHRVIFLYHHGYLPEYVDHKDTNPSNNKIENLRECTKAQNSQNKNATGNKSGCKGVYFRKDKSQWRVCITKEGKKYNFGSHKDFELAQLIANEAREMLHKEFAREH